MEAQKVTVVCKFKVNVARQTNRRPDTIVHTTCRMSTEAVPAIAIPATGAAELMAKAIADAQDAIRTSVSMKKKNFSASDSRPIMY